MKKRVLEAVMKSSSYLSENSVEGTMKAMDALSEAIALLSTDETVAKRKRCVVAPAASAKPAVPTKAERTKANAGKNEQLDIAAIVTSICEKNSAGLKLAAAFKERFGDEILDARSRQGNRGVHYDFEIRLLSEPEVWKHVEHKGTKKYLPIGASQTPWKAGVQFHNGGCEKYTIAKKYARIWYDKYVGNGYLKEMFDMEADVPGFDEWLEKDLKTQDNPKSAFGAELKKKVRAVRGERASLTDLREAVNADFHVTEEEMLVFKKEVVAVLTASLEQKDYWLTVQGDIESGRFYCAWYPPFTIGSADDIDVKVRIEKDIWFDFVMRGAGAEAGAGEEVTFSSILRWGKGAGFSNLRIDAR